MLLPEACRSSLSDVEAILAAFFDAPHRCGPLDIVMRRHDALTNAGAPTHCQHKSIQNAQTAAFVQAIVQCADMLQTFERSSPKEGALMHGVKADWLGKLNSGSERSGTCRTSGLVAGFTSPW